MMIFECVIAVPKTEIIGEPIRYVKGGSNVILRCIVSEGLEPPLYISWFYNSKQIYNENSQGWKIAFERDARPAIEAGALNGHSFGTDLTDNSLYQRSHGPSDEDNIVGLPVSIKRTVSVSSLASILFQCECPDGIKPKSSN